MKKWGVCLWALAILLVVLVGCGAPMATQNNIKLGLDLSTRDEFLTSMEAVAVKAAGEHGVSLDVANANNDQDAQLAQIEEWAEKGYAAALVVLCEDAAAARVLEKAGSMPVVFISHRPSDEVLASRANVFYIGSREPDAGRMQGEYLSAHFMGLGIKSPHIAVIAGNADNIASVERIKAAKDALENAGLTPQYIYETDADWERALAQKDFSVFLKKNKPRVDAVLAANDEMAIGSADALSQAGYAIADILVVGVDATPAGRAAIRDGRLNFTAYQDPVAQGAGAIDTVMTVLGGSQPEDMQGSIRWLEYLPVTAENVDKLFPQD